MSGSNAQRTAYSVFNGFAPKDGPKALPITFDFSEVNSQSFNLLLENTNGVIGFVQSVFVDNGSNPNPLVLYFQSTGQRLTIPAAAQGIWPVFSIDQVEGVISSVIDPDAKGMIILLNVPMPLTQWGPTTVNANITASPIQPATLAADFSDVITTGGSSQPALAANANRFGFVIQNPSDAIEPLYIDFGVTAAAQYTSIEILAGQSFPANGQPYVYTGAVNIMGATTGHQYIAKEFA